MVSREKESSTLPSINYGQRKQWYHFHWTHWGKIIGKIQNERIMTALNSIGWTNDWETIKLYKYPVTGKKGKYKTAHLNWHIKHIWHHSSVIRNATVVKRVISIKRSTRHSIVEPYLLLYSWNAWPPLTHLLIQRYSNLEERDQIQLKLIEKGWGGM